MAICQAEAEGDPQTAGLIDASAFAKHRVYGSGATAFLDWLTTNKLPKVGRINLTYALTETGTRTEYTIVRLAEDDYYLISAGAWADYDGDNLRKLAEDKAGDFGQMIVRDITTQWGVFAWPARTAARSCKRSCAMPIRHRAGQQAFPVAVDANIELGMCRSAPSAWPIPANWDGNCITRSNLAHLWDLLVTAGEKHGLKLVGRAGAELAAAGKILSRLRHRTGPRRHPAEAGLDRFVDLEKDFRGKQAMLERASGKCVTLLIDGPADADPLGREGCSWTANSVGRLTSGGYSAAFGKAIGMGYVR